MAKNIIGRKSIAKAKNMRRYNFTLRVFSVRIPTKNATMPVSSASNIELRPMFHRS